MKLLRNVILYTYLMFFAVAFLLPLYIGFIDPVKAWWNSGYWHLSTIAELFHLDVPMR